MTLNPQRLKNFFAEASFNPVCSSVSFCDAFHYTHILEVWCATNKVLHIVRPVLILYFCLIAMRKVIEIVYSYCCVEKS